MPTLVGGWALVAVASLADALARSTLAWPNRRISYQLLALELLTVALWALASFPAIALVRHLAAPAATARAWFLRAVGVGLPFTLAMFEFEQQVLHLLVHTSQVAFAQTILPGLDIRVVAFVALAALVRRPPASSVPRRPRTSTARDHLQLLTAQLQSHFLFNTLNEAAELVHEDADAADEMITRLSDFLRASLSHTGRELVPLRDELPFMRAHADIEAVRLGTRLMISWQIAPEAAEALIPTFIWQPLLENAFRYGATPGDGCVTLEIGARLLETDLELWIRDLGPGLEVDHSGEPGHGLGLRLTRERLALLYGGGASVELREVAGGTRAAIRVPFELARTGAVAVES
ncbi:MAG TPA: histidine kinase [Gemmatimonadales bacterium]|nr:histidine kinase [Gemmatimonadales bacterium]